jgi:two-component system copper resistance phosphate regulon response regulator CusR
MEKMADRPKTVLIVEDEVDWREQIFRESLENEGLIVFAAATYDESIELVDQHAFDLAVVDINLTNVPGNVQGAQVMRYIRDRQDTRLIVVSGSRERNQKQIEDIDYVAFIEKDSFDIVAFVQVVREIMELN